MLRKAKPADKGRKSQRPGLEALRVPRESRLPKHLWRLAFGDKPRIRATTHFKRWQLQEAKAKFSELFERAIEDGPQVVTRHNKEAVVVLSEEQFRKLADIAEKPGPDMLATLLNCPPGPDLNIPRREGADDVLDLPPVFD
jgi:antitoxin Phd